MALPLRDDGPRRTVPWLTLGLIVANVVVFLFLQPASLQRGAADTNRLSATEDRELSEHAARWGAVPCEIRARESRGEGGGVRCTEDIDGPIVAGKSVWASLLTHMFLHGSLFHLIGNMLFLWIFGAAVEDRLGPGPFIGLYLLSGLAGTLVFAATAWGSAAPALGASGAVSGAMGAFVVLHARRRVLSITGPLPFMAVVLPAWALVGLYFATQFLTPDDAGIAWPAHVGGLVVGGLLALAGRAVVRDPARPRAIDGRGPDHRTWVVPASPPVEAGQGNALRADAGRAGAVHGNSLRTRR